MTLNNATDICHCPAKPGNEAVLQPTEKPDPPRKKSEYFRTDPTSPLLHYLDSRRTESVQRQSFKKKNDDQRCMAGTDGERVDKI
jgi:hypothetical protein